MNTVTREVKLSFRPLRQPDSAGHAKGAKRDSFVVPVSVPVLADEIQTAAAATVLELYVKELVAENADNWNYRPSTSAITLASWHAWNTRARERAERAVTAVTIASFAELYELRLCRDVGKSAIAASTGAELIRGKFRKIAGNSEFCAIMLQNIESVMSVCSEDELSHHEKVISWCVDSLTELVSPVATVTADML